ncbi:MAG TPA: pilus assembly protein [Allosphingosinicella sp.]|jgi:Flp pilus assembly protein TadG
MTPTPPPPRSLLRRLARDDRALALTEFALSLPILLSLGLVGLETANLAIANLRVSNIAMLTADSAARVRDSIDEADVNEIFVGARTAGTALNFTQNGRIILSSLEPNTAGANGTSTGQYIRWQRCIGIKNVASAYGAEGKGRTDASLQAVGPAGNQVAAQAGTAVMVVEVNYDYQPLVSNRIFGARTITYVSAFNVRQRTDQVLHNASAMSGRTCDKFSAT